MPDQHQVRADRSGRRSLVVAIVLAVIGGGTAHASASPPPTPVDMIMTSLVAGYVVEPAEELSSASASLKVPTAKCDRSDPLAVRVGVGDALEPEAPRLGAHLLLDCQPGGRADTALVVHACGDQAGPLAVKHGRRVQLMIAHSGGMITATATDLKSGDSVSASSPVGACQPGGSFASVLVGASPVFAPDLLDVPNFNKIKIQDAMVNGDLVSGERRDRDTEPGITVGPLRQQLAAHPSTGGTSARAGDTFALRYRGIVHCCLRQTGASVGADT